MHYVAVRTQTLGLAGLFVGALSLGGVWLAGLFCEEVLALLLQGWVGLGFAGLECWQGFVV